MFGSLQTAETITLFSFFFFFNDTATTEIYTLSLHDALPISPSLKRAVLVAEDAAFWQHDGVDYAELQKSIELDWARGQLLRGASTITQQLAKNLYLSPSRNPLRKLRELIIARRLEAELKKARILELYLNVIEWGDGIYGVEAAARTYFGSSAAE